MFLFITPFLIIPFFALKKLLDQITLKEIYIYSLKSTDIDIDIYIALSFHLPLQRSLTHWLQGFYY